MVAAPLARVGLEERLRNAAERRAPRRPVAVLECDLQIRGTLRRRAGERLRALVDLGHEALAGGRVDLGLELTGDGVEQRLVLRPRVDDALPLAALQVDVDLAGAERIRPRATPVDAREEVVVLVPR